MTQNGGKDVQSTPQPNVWGLAKCVRSLHHANGHSICTCLSHPRKVLSLCTFIPLSQVATCRQQGVLAKWDKLRSAAANGNDGKLLDELELKVTHPQRSRSTPCRSRGVLDIVGVLPCRYS